MSNKHVNNPAPLTLPATSIEVGYSKAVVAYGIGNDADLTKVAFWVKNKTANSAEVLTVRDYDVNDRIFEITDLVPETLYGVQGAFVDEFLAGTPQLLSAKNPELINLVSFTDFTTKTPVSISEVTVTSSDLGQIGSPPNLAVISLQGEATEAVVQLLPTTGLTGDDASAYDWSLATNIFRGKVEDGDSITISTPTEPFVLRVVSAYNFANAEADIAAPSYFGTVSDPVEGSGETPAPSAPTDLELTPIKIGGAATTYNMLVSWEWFAQQGTGAKRNALVSYRVAGTDEWTVGTALDNDYLFVGVPYRTTLDVQVTIKGWNENESSTVSTKLYISEDAADSSVPFYMAPVEGSSIPANTNVQLLASGLYGFKDWDGTTGTVTFKVDADNGNVAIGETDPVTGTAPLTFDAENNRLAIKGSAIIDSIVSADYVMGWLGGNTPTFRTANRSSNGFDESSAGIWMGYSDADTFQMSLGNGSEYIRWDGSHLTISGQVRIGNSNTTLGQKQKYVQVYKRAPSTPEAPSGGTYGNPIPTGWSKTIPVYNGQACYVSFRTLTSDGEEPQDQFWAAPSVISENIAPARIVSLTADSQVIKFDSAGVPDREQVVITAATQNIEEPEFLWDTTSGSGTASANVYTIPRSALALQDSLTVTVTVATPDGDVTDSITIIRVQDGNEGTSSLNGYLTNEAHVVSAYANGTVQNFEGANGVAKLFYGETDVSAGTSFSLIEVSNGLTINIDSSTGAYAVSGLNKDTASATIVMSHPTYGEFTRTFSISKSKSGTAGSDGQDGQSAYIHIAYANNATGTSGFNTVGGTYMGQYSSSNPAASTDPADYTWTKIQGPQGEQGTQGPKGSDGQTTYFHVAYANNSTGSSGFNQSSGAYIGTYVDTNPADSTDYRDYNWVKIEGSQGPEGDQGIPGNNGSDGETSYLHIAYANNSTGTSGFNQSSGTYIGQYVDFVSQDSTDPSDYTWTKLVVHSGYFFTGLEMGEPVVVSANAQNTTTYSSDSYTGSRAALLSSTSASPDSTGYGQAHFVEIPSEAALSFAGKEIEITVYAKKGPNNPASSFSLGYSTSDVGNSGWADFSLTDKYKPYTTYYTVPLPSAGALDYLMIHADTSGQGKEVLIDNISISIRGAQGEQGPQGPQGTQGTQGPKGSDGQTTYFHVAYANNSTGSSGFNQSSGAYIGTYVDTNPADSTDYRDYNWVKIEGSQGPEGDQGIPGNNGSDGETSYLHIAYANNSTGTSGFNQSSGTYIGQYVDFVSQDSTDPSDYTWTKIKGDKGDKGNTGNTGAQGNRGAGTFTVGYSGTWPASFNNTLAAVAAGAVTDDVPVINDVVTVYSLTNPINRYVVRYSGGSKNSSSSWGEFELVIHGDALIEGTVVADEIVAGTLIESPDIRGGRLEISGGDSTVILDSDNTESPISITDSTGTTILGWDNEVFSFRGRLGTGKIDNMSVFSQAVQDIIAPPIENTLGGTYSGENDFVDNINDTAISSIAVFECNDHDVIVSGTVNLFGEAVERTTIKAQLKVFRSLNGGSWTLISTQTVSGRPLGEPGFHEFHGTQEFTVEDSSHGAVAEGDTLAYKAEVKHSEGAVHNILIRLRDFSIAQQRTGGSVAGNATSATFPYVGLDLSGSSSYPRMFLNNNPGTSSVWLRAPSNSGGFLPYANGNSSIGTNSWKWREVHSVNVFENGTKLSDKYLGKNAKAVNSAAADNANKLDNLDSTQFLRSDQNSTINGQLSIRHTNVQLNLVDSTFEDRYWQLDHQNGLLSFRYEGGSAAFSIASGGLAIFSSELRANSFTENGTSLEAKYLGKSAKAVDSDKLDGINSSQFARTDIDETFNNKVWVGGGISAGSNAILQVKGFMRTGDVYIHEGGGNPNGNSGTLGNVSGSLSWNGSKIWTEGNDGPLGKLDEAKTWSSRQTFNSFADYSTNIGRSSTSLLTLASGEWSKPVGYSTMLRTSSEGMPSNKVGTYAYWNVLSRRDTAGGYVGLLTPYTGNGDMFIGNAGTSGESPTWHQVWTSGSDGAGSGLDADKLDGLQGSQFVRKDANNVITSNTVFTSKTTPITTNSILLTNTENNAGQYYTEQNGVLVFDENFSDDHEYGTGPTSPMGTFESNGGGLVIKNEDGWGAVLTSQNTRWADSSFRGLTVGSHRVWHAGNDGAGSGLDADKLDGLQGDQFARQYKWEVGANPGNRLWIKLFTLADTDSSITGTFSSGGDYGDRDRASYHLIIGTRSGGITVRIYSASEHDVAEHPEFYYKDNGKNQYEVWVMVADYNKQHYFTRESRYGGITVHEGISGTITPPSGVTHCVPNTIWNSGNDGAGSGLDADKLDGLQASQFLRSDVSDTFSGTMTIQKAGTALIIGGGTAFDSADTDVYIGNGTGTGDEGYGFRLKYHGTGSGSANKLSLTATNLGSPRQVLDIPQTGVININQLGATVSGNLIWHAGNDGSGSGLDADKLDGLHGSSFLKNNNSSTGNYSTTGHIISGRSSGGVALTINDGQGNANVTFNHTDGKPEQNGNSARIEVNTDDSANAKMMFEVKSGVTAGAVTTMNPVLTLHPNLVSSAQPMEVLNQGNNQALYVKGGIRSDKRFFDNNPTGEGGLVGNYQDEGSTDKIIWTIGTSWMTHAKHYGIGYHRGAENMSTQHQIVVKDNGNVGIRLGMIGDIWAARSVNAPVLKENSINISDKYLNINQLSYNSPDSWAAAFTAVDQFKEWVTSGSSDTSGYSTITESIATGFVNSIIGQFNTVIADQGNIGHLTARSIEVTGRQRLINNPSGSGHLDGWYYWGSDLYMASAASRSELTSGNLETITENGASVEAIKVSGTGNRAYTPNAVEIDHNAIYEVSVGVKSTGGTGGRRYVGLMVSGDVRTDKVHSRLPVDTYDATTREFVHEDPNFYFWNSETQNQMVYVTGYVVGANRSVDEVPQTNRPIVKLSPDSRTLWLRVLNWANGSTNTTMHIYNPTINEVRSGRIVSHNIVADQITSTHIAANTIDASHIKVNSITANEIAANSITTSELAANSVNASHIVANSVTANEIAANSITTSELAAQAVQAENIKVGTITSNHIATGSIVAEDIKTNAITAQQIAADAITSSELKANSVTSGHIVAGTIQASDIAANTITAGQIAANAITASELAANSVNAGHIVAGTITATEIAANAITASELAANSVNAGHITANSITAGEIATNAITANELAANSVNASHIVANSITAGEIATNAITANELAANSVNAGHITANSITASELAANTVSASHIVGETITANEIAFQSLTGDVIATNTLEARSIKAESITATKLALGTTENSYPDYDMLDKDFYYPANGGSSYILVGTGNSKAGRQRIRIPSSTSQDNNVRSGNFTLEPDTEYNISLVAYSESSVRTVDVYIQYGTYDYLGVITWGSIPKIASASTTAEQKFSLNFKTLPNTRVGRLIMITRQHSGDPAYGSVSSIVLRKRLTGSLIVDGSITADHIAANTITANELDVGSISVEELSWATGGFGESVSVDGSVYSAQLYVTPGGSSGLAIYASSGYVAPVAVFESTTSNLIDAMRIHTYGAVGLSVIAGKRTSDGNTTSSGRGLDITSYGGLTANFRNATGGQALLVQGSSSFIGNAAFSNTVEVKDGNSLRLFPSGTTSTYQRMDARTSGSESIIHLYGIDTNGSSRAGRLAIYGGSTYNYIEGHNGQIGLRTPHGYCRIGPQNTSWSHFTTDRASFYFNKKVAVAGDVTFFYSDERLKTVTGSLDTKDALANLRTWKPVRYVGNHIAKANGFDEEGEHIGLLAQDIEKHYPELTPLAPFDQEVAGVSKSGENYKTLKYERTVAVLVAALQEEADQREKLEDKVERLEALVNKLLQEK